MKNTKKVYTTPVLTVHGDASKLTQQTTQGNRFDREFNADAVTLTNILSFS